MLTNSINEKTNYWLDVPPTVFKWINVSNNVTTAPPNGGAAWLRT
jgi:hypothetical protein